MSKLNNRKSNRRLGFENLEAREYLSASGWAPSITEIQIGPIPQITSPNTTREIVLDTSIVIPAATAQLQALETDDFVRDLSHDLFSGNALTQQEYHPGMGEPGPHPIPQSQPIIITVSIGPGPQTFKPGSPFGSSIFVGGVSIAHDYESKYESHPQPPLALRFTQDIIASYGASFISNNNVSTKTEITNVSLSSSSFKLSSNTQQQPTTDADVEIVANRLSETTNKAPNLQQSLEQYKRQISAAHSLDQLTDRLADDNAMSLSKETDETQFKSQPAERSQNSIRSSESDLKSDDGLIALSTHYDLLPIVSTDAAVARAPTMAWTQRVAIGQSMQALRPSPKSQSQSAVNIQSDEEASLELQQSNQYWAIVPVAVSMFAIDWFRRHLHLRKHKAEDETFVSKVQLR